LSFPFAKLVYYFAITYFVVKWCHHFASH